MLESTDSTLNDSPFLAAQAGKPWPIARSTELGLLIAIVAAQIAILVGMIALDGLPLALGERIKLKVVPVDPRDLFRGDYVVLDYEFSRFEPASVHGLDAPDPSKPYNMQWVGKEIYVSLAPAGNHYEAKTRSVTRPASGLYIRGTVGNNWQNRLECGIEAYYVQEGEGRRLENLIRQKGVLAEVAVWNGRAKLVRLVE